jgi:nitrite reductase/ring-hydroxylating ferredoxin subunit
VSAQERWTGIALDHQIQPASSNPVILGGQALAVWRGEDGPVRVWEDRCPHRGMRLSFGFVRGDTLRCIYHGWAYGTDGQCVEIPAHPALTPPKTICANSYPAEPRYGIVWTTLADGADGATLPDLGADEGWEPVRSVFVQAAAGMVLERLQGFDFGNDGAVRMAADNVAEAEVGPGLRVLIAVQAMDGERTALHAVASGPRAAGERAALAGRHERLRGDIERACGGRDDGYD